MVLDAHMHFSLKHRITDCGGVRASTAALPMLAGSRVATRMVRQPKFDTFQADSATLSSCNRHLPCSICLIAMLLQSVMRQPLKTGSPASPQHALRLLFRLHQHRVRLGVQVTTGISAIEREQRNL